MIDARYIPQCGDLIGTSNTPLYTPTQRFFLQKKTEKEAKQSETNRQKLNATELILMKSSSEGKKSRKTLLSQIH